LTDRAQPTPVPVDAPLAGFALPLFVPADRPERIGKALAAGTDAVIVDLEDAVAPAAKAAAREGLAAALAAPLAQVQARRPALLLRVNASRTPWQADDLAVAARLPLDGVVLPKAEAAADVAAVRAASGGRSVLALIETVAGLQAVQAIAGEAGRLAFGSVDFAADLGCVHVREALAPARWQVVLASRLAGLPPAIDGVTLAIGGAEEIESDARYAATLGFGGKLLIHPAQIAPARRGLRPTAEELAWAAKIAAAAAGGGAAQAVAGNMVDAPVLAYAQALLARARTFSEDDPHGA
jgi:citrate lyase subunit beta / citryl-CoA lyase